VVTVQYSIEKSRARAVVSGALMLLPGVFVLAADAALAQNKEAPEGEPSAIEEIFKERSVLERTQLPERLEIDLSHIDRANLSDHQGDDAAGAALTRRKQEPADEARGLEEILLERALQEQPVLRRPQLPELLEIDPSRLKLAEPADDAGGDQSGDETGVIRFDETFGDPIPSGTVLNDQYAGSHNIAFGRGATIQTCSQASVDDVSRAVRPSLCAYPRAASGQNAALYDLRGGQALRLDFSKEIMGLSVTVNPTGGAIDEPFEMRLTGFGADGKQIAQSSLDFVWRQDAFTWPTTAGLAIKEGRMARVTMELRRPRRAGQSVRFLFDDLVLHYAPDREDSPVFAALDEQQRPPRINEPEIVQSPNDESLRGELRLYPPATRIRTAIDWPAANATLAEQAALGLGAAALGDEGAIDVAELPVLAPSRADAGTLSIAGQRDSYHADFDRDGRGYSIYGTRVLTRIRPANGAAAPTENLRYIELEYGIAATFSLYGASYTVTRYCLNDSPDEDPACYDKDALGDMAREIVVVIGEAGERTP